jgi:hypothetical protein
MKRVWIAQCVADALCVSRFASIGELLTQIGTMLYIAVLMGKYVAYALVVLSILFALEWLEIVDIPFLEIPDFTGGKEEMIDKTKDTMKSF